MPDFDTITIEEATERLIDYRGKTPPKTDSGIRLITAKVVKGGRILEEPKEFISASFYDAWMRRGLPRKFDVLLTTEAPLGEVAVLRDSERIALAQRIILLRAKPGHVDPLFLFYALQSDFGQGELKARASGTTVSGIKQSELRQVRIPIFRLRVQHRIAGILSAYDDLIENNLRRIRILEEMARSTYREWFVNYRFPGHEKVRFIDSPLGKIPEGWNVVELADLAESPRRGVQKGRLSTGMRYVGLEHIPRRSLALDSWEEVQSLGSNKLTFERGEILFGKIRPYFHKVSVAPFDGVCSADTIIIRARNAEHWALITMYVSSDDFVAQASAAAQGSKMPRADWNVVSRYLLVAPPDALLDKFSPTIRGMTSLQMLLVQQSRRLRESRDLLLPRLLSGETDLPGVDAPSLEFKTNNLIATENEEESATPPQASAVPSIDQTDQGEVLAIIRQIFSNGFSGDRDDAVRAIGRELGYQRTGPRIQEILNNDIRTAVRRGILDNSYGELRLLARSITDYDRNFLKNQFLAAIDRGWIERDEAIQNFCRWMGFRRTGSSIDETARSLINGLLRENRIEANGAQLIRRVQ